MRAGWWVCAVAVGAAVTAGCAAEGDRADVSDTAARFLDAARKGNAYAACALLTPRTRQDLVASDGPCADALPTDELGGSVTATDTWSDWAKVDTSAGVLFLTEFESGWFVAAAGCAPERDAPYHCVVGG